MDKKNILITGGLGFIGSSLAKKYVSQGHNVSILSRSSKKIGNIKGIESKVKLILKEAKDINGEDVLNQDYIFHFAGSVDNYSIKKENKDRDPYRDIQANCVPTISLLEAVAFHNPQSRIIFGSTFFVNGDLEEKDLPANPDSSCNPNGLYPATRLCSEHFCRIYHNNFGVDVIIPRFSNVFGPFEEGKNPKKAGFNFMINQAINKETLNLYNNGEFYRDYIYVDDVVNACMVLAEKGETNQTYYVGRGEKTKFKDLIEIVKGFVPGTKVKPIDPPEFHKKIGITNFVCDNSQLKKLGWEPQTSLKDGIKKTIDFYSKDFLK